MLYLIEEDLNEDWPTSRQMNIALKLILTWTVETTPHKSVWNRRKKVEANG